MTPPPNRSRSHVFISYSHADEAWRERIHTALKPVLRDSDVELWDDNKILPGAKWQEEIEKALARAGVALLLVSQNFLASNYIHKYELPVLLAAAEAEGLIVLWVAVSASTFEETGIAQFQAINNPKKPLDQLAGPKQKAELVEIARKFKAVVEKPVAAPDTTSYFEYLRSETGYIKITGLKTGPAHRYPVGALYIHLKNHEKLDLEQALKNRCLVIQGDAGSGKSTFIRHIAFAALADPKRFPIYIPIRDLEQHISKLHEQNPRGAPAQREDPRWIAHYLAHQRHWTGLNQAFFEQKLAQASTTVLLDGLDETPDEVSRRRMAELFSCAAARTFKNAQFVVTTRPAAYIGDVRLADFAVERIAPLDDEAIETFLNAWSSCLYPENPAKAKSHAEELLTQVNARPEIRQHMAPTPVMLTALAAINYNERRLPDDRADLYKSILYWLAGSRERKPGRRRDKECLKLLALLAFGMQTNATGRLAQAERSMAATMLEAKLPIREEAISFLEEEELDSGILVSRGSKVEFLHLTFQEYLAASHLEGLRESDQSVTILQGQHRYSPEWREFLCLFGAALSESRMQWLFEVILENADGTLGGRARALALITALLQDKKGLEVEHPLYGEFARDMIRLFDLGPENRGVDAWTRANAAVAWEKLEDYSRRRRPSDDDYWVDVGPFQIGQFPVTVWEYEFFVREGGAKPQRWTEQLKFKNRPVVGITWHNAMAYCEWCGCRLPSDDEWYLAAAGPEQREYPWGRDEPDGERANFNMDVGRVTPVGLFPAGATLSQSRPLLDIAGNVFEWSANPCDSDKDNQKVVLGADYFNAARNLRAPHRGVPQGIGYSQVGFRCLRQVVGR